MTVALVFLLSERIQGFYIPPEDPTQREYLDFLRQSFHSTPTPDIPIIATAWILLSSPSFTPGKVQRSSPREALGFPEYPPAARQLGADLLCSASEAYRTLYTPSR